MPTSQFFDKVSKTAVDSCIISTALKSSIRFLNLNCFNTSSNFILISWIVCKEVKTMCFAFCCSFDLLPRSKSPEWYKVVELNGVYKSKKYERIWWKILHVMSNVFAVQDSLLDVQPDRRTRLNIDWCVTYMDQTLVLWVFPARCVVLQVQTMLGLVSPLSVHWWGEIASWCITSVPLWQHVPLSKQICSWDMSCMLLGC